MKPTDIAVCLERKHQDGGWRLVFFEDLWRDPSLNVTLPPVLNALGFLGERKPLLFWLLAHIQSDTTDWIVKPARLRLENTHNPEKKDTILGAMPHTESFLFKGLPKDPPEWASLSPWKAHSWHWIDGHTLFCPQRLEIFDYEGQISEWVETLKLIKQEWDTITPFLPYSWSRHGTGLHTLEADEPVTALSAHDRLNGMKDTQGLLPFSNDTFRLIVGFN